MSDVAAVSDHTHCVQMSMLTTHRGKSIHLALFDTVLVNLHTKMWGNTCSDAAVVSLHMDITPSV